MTQNFSVDAVANRSVYLVFSRIDNKLVVRKDGAEIYNRVFHNDPPLNERIGIARGPAGTKSVVEFDLINFGHPHDARRPAPSPYHFVFTFEGIDQPVDIRLNGSSPHRTIATYRYEIAW